MKIDEDAETGALRELKEETGLETGQVEQFGCFTDVNRDPRERVITIAFMSLVKKTDVHGGDDADDFLYQYAVIVLEFCRQFVYPLESETFLTDHMPTSSIYPLIICSRLRLRA